MAEVLLPELSVESLGQRESANEEERSMSSELLYAKHLLAKTCGLLELMADRGSPVAKSLLEQVEEFVWPEESRENPTLEISPLADGQHAATSDAVSSRGERQPMRECLNAEGPNVDELGRANQEIRSTNFSFSESRLSTDTASGAQCGEPCGSTEGSAVHGVRGEAKLPGCEKRGCSVQSTGCETLARETRRHSLINPSGYQAPPAGVILKVEIEEYVYLVKRSNDVGLSPIRIYEDDGA